MARQRLRILAHDSSVRSTYLRRRVRTEHRRAALSRALPLSEERASLAFTACAADTGGAMRPPRNGAKTEDSLLGLEVLGAEQHGAVDGRRRHHGRLLCAGHGRPTTTHGPAQSRAVPPPPRDSGGGAAAPPSVPPRGQGGARLFPAAACGGVGRVRWATRLARPRRGYAVAAGRGGTRCGEERATGNRVGAR